MRAVREYYSGVPTHDLILGDAVFGNNPTHAVLDLLLGHVMANLVFGATFFAVLGVYFVDVQKTMFNFFEHDLKLGKDAPILLPWVTSLIPIFLASLEFFIRKALDKQKDTTKDVSVHTPFPNITPFSRQAATAGIMLLLTLQTLNGVANVEPGKLNPVYEDMSKAWHKDPLAMLMGQLLFVKVAGKIVDKAPGIVAASTRAVIFGCSGLWEKATACCRSRDEYALVSTAEP